MCCKRDTYMHNSLKCFIHFHYLFIYLCCYIFTVNSILSVLEFQALQVLYPPVCHQLPVLITFSCIFKNLS